MLFVCADPILNLAFGVWAAPVIPVYPGMSNIQRSQQRIDYGGVRRIATGDTLVDSDTVLAYFEQHLGPTRQAWKQDSFRGLRRDPTRLRTWTYQRHCPDTFVDLKYADFGAGRGMITTEVTEYSCRDAVIVVLIGNVWPFR